MQIDVVTMVGSTKYIFHIDERLDKEALHKAAVLGNPPHYCPLCANRQYFELVSNKDKEGNTYVNILCKKCGAKAKLGEYKAGGFFWHKFEKYQQQAEQEQGAEGLPNDEGLSEAL